MTPFTGVHADGNIWSVCPWIELRNYKGYHHERAFVNTGISAIYALSTIHIYYYTDTSKHIIPLYAFTVTYKYRYTQIDIHIIIQSIQHTDRYVPIPLYTDHFAQTAIAVSVYIGLCSAWCMLVWWIKRYLRIPVMKLYKNISYNGKCKISVMAPPSDQLIFRPFMNKSPKLQKVSLWNFAEKLYTSIIYTVCKSTEN